MSAPIVVGPAPGAGWGVRLAARLRGWLSRRALLRLAGVPVVVGASAGQPGKLVGILTHRDVRFAIDPNQPVSELMTKENLADIVPLSRLGQELGVDYLVIKPCSDDPQKSLDAPIDEYLTMSEVFRDSRYSLRPRMRESWAGTRRRYHHWDSSGSKSTW